jgi:membrane-bound inhibitor of C-type lysozyme
MKTNNNALFVLGGIIVIGLLMWLLGRQPSPTDTLPANFSTSSVSITQEKTIDLGADLTDALFVCNNNKAIGANFHKKGVILNLSDGRVLTLPQTISASGARYATSDESFVFWNKGDAAFIEESGSRTFDNCNVQRGEF